MPDQNVAEGTPSSTASPAEHPDKTSLFSRPAIQLLLIALVGVIAYSGSFQVPFVLDDELSIVDNPMIRDLGRYLSWEGYAWKPRRFVGYLTLALNYRLGGLDVTGYHIFNLAVHITAAWLVYALVRLTLKTPFFRAGEIVNGEKGMVNGQSVSSSSPFTIHHSLSTAFIPLFAGLLFVAHPVQTQAVTYIIQRLASLAAMFYLLSLVLYVKARLSETRSALAFLCYLGALLSAGLAMRTKEIAFTLPFVVVLYEFCFFNLTTRKKLLFLLPAVLTVIIAPLSLIGSGRPLGELITDVLEKTRLETSISRLDYLLTQFRVIVTYLRLLVFPVNQNLDYDYPVYHSFLVPPVLLSFMLLLTLFGLALYLYYRSKTQRLNDSTNSPFTIHHSRLISFGILWFFITISVESSVIPIADVIFEHRLYLPAAGAFMALAALAAHLFRNVPPKRVALGAGILVSLLTAATFARNLVWSSPVSLAQDMARKSPQKARTHYNLALALQRDGRLSQAFTEAAISSRLEPAAAKPRNLLGLLYSGRGMYDKAIVELSEAVRLDPGFAEAHANLGDALGAAGRKEQALEQYYLALKINPANAQTYNQIGLIYGETGRMDKAVAFFLSAASLAPANSAFAFNLQRALQLSEPRR